MKRSFDQLEILISRYIDGEATPAEQRALRAELRDPQARALFEEISALDREAGAAMRSALGVRHSPAFRMPRSRQRWVAGLAAAACAALATWWNLSGVNPGGDPSMNQARVVRPTAIGDMFTPETPGLEMPRVKLKDTNSEYIMIPSDKPGEYLLIELRHVQTQAVPLHRDF